MTIEQEIPLVMTEFFYSIVLMGLLGFLIVRPLILFVSRLWKIRRKHRREIDHDASDKVRN